MNQTVSFSRYAFSSWQVGASVIATPSHSEVVGINGRQRRVDYYSAHDVNRLVAPYISTGQQEQKLKDSFQLSDKHAGTVNIEDALFIIPKGDCNNAAEHVRESQKKLHPVFPTVPSFVSHDEFTKFLQGRLKKGNTADY